MSSNLKGVPWLKVVVVVFVFAAVVSVSFRLASMVFPGIKIHAQEHSNNYWWVLHIVVIFGSIVGFLLTLLFPNKPLTKQQWYVNIIGGLAAGVMLVASYYLIWL